MNLLATIAGLIGGPINAALGLVSSTMQEGFKAAIQFHKEGIAFARDVGLSAKQAQAYTNVLIERTQVLANKYGVSAEAIMQVQRGITEATGKQLLLNDAQAEGFVQINKLVGAQSASKFTEEIMNGMGGQIDTVQGAIAKVYATASKQGLNAKKLTDKVAQNLSMANRLSFRNGIDGLTRMAAMSEKLGINMSSVESAAGQFMDLDKAIENAAQLQMLGGSVGTMAGNPLTMAYEANYDPEAFAKRMSDSLASYATFDKNKGIANINGGNMMFIREIAKAMGISVDEASRMAKKRAEVEYKENKFGGQLNALGLSEEQKNFIINNGQVTNNGNDLEINGKNINQLTPDDLKNMMQFEGMSDRDILEEQAKSLISIDENITGAASSVAAAFAEGIDNYLPGMKDLVKSIGDTLTNYSKQWGNDVGRIISDALGFIRNHGPEINKAATGMLDLITKAVDFFCGGGLERLLTTVLGFFGLKWLAGNFLGNGLSSAASGGAKSGIGRKIANGAKGLWKGTKWLGGKALQGTKWLGNKTYDLIGSGGANKSFAQAKIYAKNAYRMTNGNVFKKGLRGAKSLWKNSKAVRASVKGGLGIIGAIGNMATDHFVENGTLERGGAAHTAAKVGSTALEGAALGATVGSVVPVIGTAVGGVVGGLIGAGKGYYDTFTQWQEKTGGSFMDFLKMQGSKLADTTSTWVGRIKDDLSPVWDTIKSIGNGFKYMFESLSPSNLLKKGGELANNIGGWLGSLFGGGKEKHANGGIVGASPKASIEAHANGGIVGGTSYSGDKVLTGLNSGEMVLNKQQQANLFAAINNLPAMVTSILVNRNDVRAKEYGANKEYIYVPNRSETSNVNGNQITVKDFNINLTGTIKLDGGNNSKNVDVNSLLSDRQFINNLKELIKNSINEDMNGGRVMNDRGTFLNHPSSYSVW